MTWNNGQNNGGQDDVYGRLNNTKEVGKPRFPFLEDSGKFALCSLEEFQHSTDGPSARALLEVLESKTGKHPVGSHVVKIWKLVKPPKFQGQASEADMFADFCRKLKGAPAGHPIGNDIRVLMKERPQDQLARGTVIEAVAVLNQKKTWTNIYWNNVQQSPQDIAAMRARLEQKGIPNTSEGAPAQQYMQPQYPSPQSHSVGFPVPQPQGVPPGGFLANVPPQNNGGNNGNGGNGSW